MIENRFLYFRTYADFKAKFDQGKIDAGSIVFIEDRSIIWTHNKAFQNGAKEVKLDNVSRGDTLPNKCWDCVFTYNDDAVFTLPIVYNDGNYLFSYAKFYDYDVIQQENVAVEKAWLFEDTQVSGYWENNSIPSELRRYVPGNVLDRISNVEECLTWD